MKLFWSKFHFALLKAALVVAHSRLTMADMTCDVGCDFQSAFDNQDTNFTCAELIDYCDFYSKWMDTQNKIGLAINASLLLAGFGGLISYILMIIVFQLPTFNGASYIYHKSIVYMELAHMFVMAQSGLERFLPTDKTSYSYIFYIKIIRELWLLGDAMKLSTSLVTTFLSLERFIAIWLPRLFTHFNRPKVAWSLITVSTLISLLSFSPAFTSKMALRVKRHNETEWVAVPRSGQGSVVGGDQGITIFIYVVKAITSTVIVICCVGVAVGLYLNSKKADGLSSNARRRWHENRRLSILQIVIALSQLIDHLFWVISCVVGDMEPKPFLMGFDAVISPVYNFKAAVEAVRFKRFARWTFACQEITGEFDHATRLPLYLVGMQKFRVGFFAFMRTGNLKKVVVDMKKTTLVTPSAAGPSVVRQPSAKE